MSTKVIVVTLVVLVLLGMLAYFAVDTNAGGLFHTATPTLTNTSTFTMTPTSTASQTPAQLALSPAQAEAEILNLLQDNGGCLLPCWWGLMPGETSAQTTKSFLDRLASKAVVNVFTELGGYEYWVVSKDDLTLAVSITVSYDNETGSAIQNFQVTAHAGDKLEDDGSQPAQNDPLNKRLLQAYMLPQVLSTYGQPNEVLIFVDQEYWKYLELVVNYSDRGFALWYSTRLESSSSNFSGCPSKANFKLYSWIPEPGYTWADAVGDTTGTAHDLDKYFLSLGESTSLTVDEFYQAFKDPAHTGCVETPMKLWQVP